MNERLAPFPLDYDTRFFAFFKFSYCEWFVLLVFEIFNKKVEPKNIVMPMMMMANGAIAGPGDSFASNSYGSQTNPITVRKIFPETWIWVNVSTGR
jgi:hypothetical protein